MRIAFVLPYGARSDGFFPDTFVGVLAADAVAAGHLAEVARVYYDGDRGDGDRAIASRLASWLDAGCFDVVVVERLFDDAPIAAWRAAATHRRVVLVVRGDSIEPSPTIDLIVGWQRGATRGGLTRRAVTVWQIAECFAALVAAIAAGGDPATVPGIAVVRGGAVVSSSPLPVERGARRALMPLLAQTAIANGAPPAVTRRTVFGNAGCPYAADPREAPLYRGLAWPAAVEVAERGCGFCPMGGDYERRPDALVVASLVAQARHITTAAPTTTELVLDDQHALRYLAELIAAAAAAGVPPLRWLFAARADSFVRERDRVEAAIGAAAASGAAIETYLTGFEAFSDRELARYHKGTTVAEALAAIAAMRELAARHPRTFDYARARGHSLILWNPWTTPEDLAQSIAVVRDHQLGELFHELGRNRLRLYPDLPIYYAAERDGALVAAWDDGDHGAGRGKGYHSERPWRFLDPRTALAWRLATGLRARLGATTEVAQLAAVAAFAARFGGEARDVGAAVAQVEAGLERLAARLAALAQRRGEPARGRQVRAAVVRLTPWRDAVDEVDAARATGLAVVLAAADPPAHPQWLALVARAAGPERRPVGVVAEGRAFSDAGVAAAAVAAGITSASVTAHAGGVAALRHAGIRALELRWAIDPDGVAAGLAGGTQVRLEVALDRLDLGALDRAVDILDGAVAAAGRVGIGVEVSPLDAGTTLASWMPVVPSEAR